MLTAEADAGLADEFLAGIDFSGGAVAAVSGGSDSTALLLLLKRHLERAAPAAKLLAVTIDHGLRPDSAAEARAVATFCAGRGIAHRTFAWSGEKPVAGLPAAAREARYRFLSQAARDAGIGMVLTGHTADDQAETVLMRSARSSDPDSGRRGLAGMAPATLHDAYGKAVWIMRPLLGVRRAALRDFLRREGVGWAEDPTNADERYERPRIRAALGGQAQAASFEEALALAGRAARERESLSRRTAALVDAFATRPSAGLLRLDPAFAQDGGDREAALHALRVLLATMGGTAFLPPEEAAAALLSRLAKGPMRTSLSRCVVDARKAGIFLHRESRGLPAAAPLRSGLWDGRRLITLGDEAGPSVIAPLGAAGAAELPGGEEKNVPAGLARAALAAEPVLSREGESLDSVGDTAISAATAQPVAAPFARFLPCFDLALAQAVGRLIGAGPLPPPPFARGSDALAEPKA